MQQVIELINFDTMTNLSPSRCSHLPQLVRFVSSEQDELLSVSEPSNNSLLESSNCMGSSSPSSYDVLCGRGRGFYNHPGNRRMLGIVAHFKDEYRLAKKLDKCKIAKRVLQLILKPPEDDPSRSGQLKFWRKGEDGASQSSSDASGQWIELSKAEAQKKVAHTLREIRCSNPAPTISKKQLGNIIASNTKSKRIASKRERRSSPLRTTPGTATQRSRKISVVPPCSEDDESSLESRQETGPVLLYPLTKPVCERTKEYPASTDQWIKNSRLDFICNSSSTASEDTLAALDEIDIDQLSEHHHEVDGLDNSSNFLDALQLFC